MLSVAFFVAQAAHTFILKTLSVVISMVCNTSFSYLCIGCDDKDFSILSETSYMRKHYVWDWEESRNDWAQYQVLVCPTCARSWERAAKRDVSRIDDQEMIETMRAENENEEYYRLVKDRTRSLIHAANVITRLR